MKRINCNNWVVIQLPSRGINEPNRNASIGTGYTVLDGSHNAENQNTEQDKTTKNRKNQHAKQQTKHTKRKNGPNSEKTGIRTGFTVLGGSHSAENQETKKRQEATTEKANKPNDKQNPQRAKQTLWKVPAQLKKGDGLCITMESAVWRATLKQKFNKEKDIAMLNERHVTEPTKLWAETRAPSKSQRTSWK